MWGCGSGNCGAQSVSAYSPGSWSVTSNQKAGNTAVLTYPNTQQLTSNWDGTGWNGFNDTPVSALKTLSSSYSDTMPGNGTGTIAQLAWDIWIGNACATCTDEVMVWMDNTGRGNGGAQFYKTYTINGQPWSLYFYGGTSGEAIWMPGTQGQYAQLHSGTVDLLALLNAMIADGLEGSNAQIGQIDFGWEICSTGGVARTFSLTSYGLTLATK